MLLILFACGEEQPKESDTADTGAEQSIVEDTSVPQDSLTVSVCDDLALPESVNIDSTCMLVEATGTLGFTTEWSKDEFWEFPEYNEVLMTPVVGALYDSNGDGLISEWDEPSVAIVTDDGGEETFQNGALRILSGINGEEQLTLRNAELGEFVLKPFSYSGIALGDIDLDGVPELVLMAEVIAGAQSEPGDVPPPEEPPVLPPLTPPTALAKCAVIAVDPEGNVEWVAEDYVEHCGGHHPVLADLEGDGSVEVVVASAIIEGSNGAVRSVGVEGQGVFPAYDYIGALSAVADLDLDGVQEVVAGNTLYDPSGNVICTTGTDDGYVAIADLDMDGMGEWALVGNGELRIVDTDCTVLAEAQLPGEGTGGPPTIGDFDGDGLPELGVATATHYAVYEANAVESWRHETTDESSHATGSILFDFEGDGAPEIVYADEVALWVLDGQTGEVRLQDNEHASRTLHEFPTVVDVDADGQPEIIVPNGGGHQDQGKKGIYVLGSDDGSWLGGPKVWNQHAFSHTNINDDLSIPTLPISNWPLYNSFRSGNLNPVYADKAPDAVPAVQVCTESCSEGSWKVMFGIGNRGTAPLRHDLNVSVYNFTSGELLSVEQIQPPIYPSELTEGIVLDVNFAHPSLSIMVSVDDNDGQEAVLECDESNNQLIVDAVCD